MLKDSLLVDRTFKAAEAMLKYAAGIDGLFVKHDGEKLDEDSTKWDDSYMNKLMVHIVHVFSHENWNHLKKVVRKLRPPK